MSNPKVTKLEDNNSWSFTGPQGEGSEGGDRINNLAKSEQRQTKFEGNPNGAKHIAVKTSIL